MHQVAILSSINASKEFWEEQEGVMRRGLECLYGNGEKKWKKQPDEKGRWTRERPSLTNSNLIAKSLC